MSADVDMDSLEPTRTAGSLFLELSVQCRTCPLTIPLGVTVQDAAARILASFGWHKLGGYWICPKCVRARR